MRKTIPVLLLILLIASTGCATLLEGEKYSEKPFVATPYVSPPEESVEVSGFDGLKDEMLRLIMEHSSLGRMYTSNYDGDIDADIKRAGEEIMEKHPIGAYIVEDISGTATRIATYYEVEIDFSYKRSAQQLNSIVYISTPRYLRTELLNAISDYRDEVVVRTSLLITEDDIAAYIEEAYYQNPRRIVVFPLTTVEIFPETGEDRIYELSFRYIDSADILHRYTTMLNTNVRRNAQRAIGDNDAEILLSLANNLIASTSFNEGAAQAIGWYGAQNLVATAYGALENGSAVGEGFAMAYKALCDELEFDCRVVLGFLDGMVHGWNIVFVNGYYYHIDVAIGAVEGIETAFLKTDQIQRERYTWDFESTVKCEGPLTYEDIVGVPDEEPSEDDGLASTDNPDDAGGSGEPNISGEDPEIGTGGHNENPDDTSPPPYDEGDQKPPEDND